MDSESHSEFYLQSSYKRLWRRNGSEKEEVDQVDRLSDLPEHIIGLILSEVSIVEAIRTSVLSSRWRYLWHGVTSIWLSKFDLDDCDDENFANFVDFVLEKCSSKELVNFRIFCYGIIDLSRANKWVHYGINHATRELTLRINKNFLDKPNYPLPQIVLSSRNLKSICLESYFDIQMPDTVVSFPHLKYLHLYIISPDQYQVMYKLLSCCPVLEELYLYYFSNCTEAWTLEISIPTLKRLSLGLDCNFNGTHPLKVVFDTPSLEYLSIVWDKLLAHYMVKELSNLRVASFTCKETSSEEAIDNYVPNLFNFFDKIAATRILTLQCPILDVLASAAARRCTRPSFRSLFVLTAHLSETSGWRCLPNVLHAAPCLGVLMLDMDDMNDVDDRPRRYYWTPPESVPHCMLSHLKTIGIKGFQGYEDEIEAVKYLLSNCQVLEKMILGVYPFFVQEDVLRLPRASKICDVILCQRFSFKTHPNATETEIVVIQ